MIITTNALFSTIFAVAFFIYLHQVWHIINRRNARVAHNSIESKRHFDGKSLEFKSRAIRNCILAKKDQNIWTYFTNITNECVKQHAAFDAYSFIDFPVGRFNESKYFLPVKSHMSKCYWLTIGIGGNTHVEEKVNSMYPECEIFGAEPSPDQYSDFEKYGTILPYAIGIKPGHRLMRIRQKPGGYGNVNVKLAPLVDVLDKFVTSRLIHFVTINIEGFEYALLEALMEGNAFQRAGVRFCQIDVELHSEGHQWQAMGVKFKFSEFWRNFLTDSRYVPVKSAETIFSHRKVTLINTRDFECQRMFDYNRYF